MTISVTVHDGRSGASASDGDIVMTFERMRPLQLGEPLQLPDGSLVKVSRSAEFARGEGDAQSVVVVDL